MFVVPRSRIFASMSEVLWLLYDLPRKEKRKENKIVVKSSYCAITCSWKKNCIFYQLCDYFFFISNQQVKTVGVSEGRSMLPYLDGHTSNTPCCFHDGQKRSTCLEGDKKWATPYQTYYICIYSFGNLRFTISDSVCCEFISLTREKDTTHFS